MVLGHRGGFFGPENSMKGFRGAIENNLDGIEFDVSVFLANEVTLSRSVGLTRA